MPGARLRWTPASDVQLMARAEYDVDNGRFAIADVSCSHKIVRDFSYTATYGMRHHRYWDFSSTPYDAAQVRNEDLNYSRYQYARLGCEYQPIDWLAFGPFIRWDLREGELDCVGTWIDYLTDCLGFRFQVEYNNDYTRLDGYKHRGDTSFGFYIYLRALGSNNSGFFGL